ncbi:sulfurtransferase [Aquabacterium sp. CECT 9606]|uniref:sulfurtransferase n=1 Tax=Aquabacterium sp. CECT 9606 TaxID=2845822 RepID=UPI001E65B232|nr:sulfurtransferase [Aquabacterium sp. CECT 9606]CAH0347818.1 Putative thiosulfate sulfurtransferase SseB [Aquabacterium sp. CECT 9606]
MNLLHQHTLISAAELVALLKQPNSDVLVLDCRFSLAAPQAGQQAYAQGHVPGAVYANLDSDLSGPKTGLNGRHPLPHPDAWLATLRGWGLQPGTEVIAYDDAGGMFAARAWWMLRWMGHPLVRVLDGGWAAWLAHGGAVSAEAPSRSPSQIQLTPHDEHLTRIDFVQTHLGNRGAMQLVDARAPDRFRGENETLDPVGGHIPGAINRFFQLNLGADGRFKPAQVLRDEFTALLGSQPVDTVVHQCGSGVTACHNLLAMTHAGLEGSRLYAGSWSEWCADQGRL